MGSSLRRLAVSDSAFAVAGRSCVHTGAVGSEPWSMEVTDLHAMSLLSTELWIVSGTNTSLSRYSLFQPAQIAVPLLLPPHCPGARLIAAPSDPVAIWNATEIAVVDGRSAKTTTSALPAKASLAIPLRAGRSVVAHDWLVQLIDRTVLWESRTVRDTSQPVLDGSPLLGGRLVALVLGRDQRRTIAVLDAVTGELVHRYALQNVLDVRFASKQQLAALRTAHGEVIVLNLASGRSRSFACEGEHIVDAAISPSGRWLAILVVSGGKMVLRGCDITVAEGAWWQVEFDEPSTEPSTALVDAPAADPPVVEIAPRPLRDPSGELPIEPVAHEPARPPPPPIIASLHPRGGEARLDPREARAVLELQLRSVASWCELALASAFDGGLVSVPFEQAISFVRRLQSDQAEVGERVQVARRHVGGATLALQRARKALGDRRAPLDDIVREFGLSPIAADILLVVASPVLWGELVEVYAMLGDRTRFACYELLVCKILGFPPSMRHEIASELEPWSPLVHSGLIIVADDRPRPFASLIPDPLVVDRLRALPIETYAGVYARPRAATCDLRDLVAPPEVIAALTQVEPRDDRPLRLVLRGRRGSGRRTALAALAALAGRLLGDIDAAALAGEGRTTAAHLARELRWVRMRGWFACVSDPGAAVDEAERVHIRRVLDDYPGPLALRIDADANPPLAPGYTLVDLPNLTEMERLAHWRTVVTRTGCNVRDLEALSARYRIGPGVITQVASAIPPRSEPVDSELGAAILQHLDDSLGNVAQRVKHLATWESLILVPEVADSLRELISRVRWSRLVFEQWGFAPSGGGRGIISLFHGVPGTGKTMAAGAIARELGVDLYRIDLSRVVSKWIGETERNLANVFRAAEESQAIILFDEADSLFAKRTEVRSSVDRYANLEVNYILQRLDTFEGIAILTSNHLSAIDPAFRRRLTVEVNFPFPDEETREQLWRIHLPLDLRDREELDLRNIARRYQLSGGYIRNAALRAAFLAAEEGVQPAQEHIERAVRLQYTQAGKFSSGGALE